MKEILVAIKNKLIVIANKFIKNDENMLNNQFGLKIKIFILFILCGVVTGGIIVKNMGEEMLGERALNIAQAVAENIDTEKFSELTMTNNLDRYNNYSLNLYYNYFKKHMINIKKGTQVKYLYSIIEYNDKYYKYIVDGNNENDFNLGSLDSKDNFSEEAEIALKTGQGIFSKIYDGGKYGNLISGFAPIINSEGEVIGLIGCDISADNLITETINHIPLIIIGTLISGIVLIFFAVINGAGIINRKKTKEKMEQLAYYDTLTGLPNKKILNYHFNKIISMSQNDQIGVLFIDMDRFKVINDTTGYAFGDKVLQKVSQILVECICDNDVIFRYGGDEFIIIMQDIKDKAVKEVAQKIINEFINPLVINGNDIYITPSIGISMYPSNGKDIESLIKYASIAMRYAKDKGRNNYKFYNYILYKKNNRKMQLENALRKALENNEFILQYQPQFNLHTTEIVGIEALIRWIHPKFGLISPSEFIPLAEETGLIIPIGKWVLTTACKQFKTWQKTYPKPIYIAVNISAIQFQEKKFTDTIKQVLKEMKLEPGYLQLEITESMIQNMKQLKEILNELKAIGVKVSIDDFGTGYSSLSVIQDIPIDTLKIDQSFVNKISLNTEDPGIVKIIIDMAKNLKLNVIAEGIENIEQVNFLKENMCNVGQGYFFSFPLHNNDIEKTLLMSKKTQNHINPILASTI